MPNRICSVGNVDEVVGFLVKLFEFTDSEFSNKMALHLRLAGIRGVSDVALKPSVFLFAPF